MRWMPARRRARRRGRREAPSSLMSCGPPSSPPPAARNLRRSGWVCSWSTTWSLGPSTSASLPLATPHTPGRTPLPLPQLLRRRPLRPMRSLCRPRGVARPCGPRPVARHRRNPHRLLQCSCRRAVQLVSAAQRAARSRWHSLGGGGTAGVRGGQQPTRWQLEPRAQAARAPTA
jgi:hypothetical protein